MLSLLRAESHLHTSFAGTLSWRRCFSLGSAHLPLLSSPGSSSDETHKLPAIPTDAPVALSSSLSIQKSLSWSSFFFSFSPSSTVFCRVSALLATLHQPLGLISVRTRLPSLPLRAPTATAHASNSTLQGTYDWPAFVNTMTPPSPH